MLKVALNRIARLSIPRKLMLVSTSFLIPDLVLMCLFLFTISGYINFGKQELRGNEYLRPLAELIDSLPQHLQLARRSLAGDAESAQQLPAAQARVDAAIAELSEVHARVGVSLQFTESGLATRNRQQCRPEFVAQRWQQLCDQLPNMEVAACEAGHWELIGIVREMVSHAGDTSNLILDPDLDSYYLMDITLLALPETQHRLATAMLDGAECLRRGVLTDKQREQFAVQAAILQKTDLDRITKSAATALNEDASFYGPSDSLQRLLPPALDKFTKLSKAFIASTDRLAGSNQPDISLADYLAEGAAAQSAALELWHVATTELDSLLQTRVAHYKNRRLLSLALAGMAFTAAIALVTYITSSISRPLQQQTDVLQQAVQAKEQNERRAQGIIEAAPDCVVTMNAEGQIVEFNHAAEQMFGYSADQAVGHRVADLLIPKRFRQEHIQGLARHGSADAKLASRREFEAVGLRADGNEFPIEIAISAVEGQDAMTFIAFVRDVTQRKEAADRLQRLLSESELLLDSISSVLIQLDTCGVVTGWNLTAENLFGLSAEEVVGKPCTELPWHEPEVAEQLNRLSARSEGQRFPLVTIGRADGSVCMLDLAVTPVCTQGECYGVLVLGNDRTEQSQLEASLRHAQKLESVGQMAAGIAHEINTPLQFLSDNIEYLSENSAKMLEVITAFEEVLARHKASEDANEATRQLDELVEHYKFPRICKQVPGAIAESMEGIERVVEIVQAMKVFSHPGSDKMLEVDLNTSIRSTTTMTRNRWKYVADMVLELPPDLPRIVGLPAEINQALLNLVVNAADAIADKVGDSGETKGTITIRTNYDENQVFVEVEDTGCGVPEEIGNRIFDPFFTTKDVGKGTGQGLSICYNTIVKTHGGSMNFTSTPGVGTTFRFSLPLKQSVDGGAGVQDDPVPVGVGEPSDDLLSDDLLTDALL